MEAKATHLTEVEISRDGKSLRIYLTDDEIKRLGEDLDFQNDLFEKYACFQKKNILFDISNSQLPQTNRSEPSTSHEQDLSRTGTSSELPKYHIWHTNETISLINSMQTHIEDLAHPKKRKLVFENVSNDLLSLGFCLTPSMCLSKWKNLVRSYNTAKDKKTRTGRGPSRFQFYDKIDELLGDRLTSTCSHTMESSNNTAQPQIEDDGQESAPSTMPTTTNDTMANKRKGKKRRSALDIVHLRDEGKNLRHKERMALEKEKLALEKEKIMVLKEFIQLKKNS